MKKRDKPPPLKIQPAAADIHHYNRPRVPLYNQRPAPVIIHTYSPEVIKTDSRNFMALVQRLTGGKQRNNNSRSPLEPPALAGKRPKIVSAEETERRPFTADNPPDPPLPIQSSSAVMRNRPPKLQQQQNHLPPLLVPTPIYHRTSPPFAAAHSSADYFFNNNNNLKPSPPPNPLLSPSLFEFSPSFLPSPSTFNFDFPPPSSSRGLLPPPPPAAQLPFLPLLWRGILPSPPPLSPGFGLSLRASPPAGAYHHQHHHHPSDMATELSMMSPAASGWMEKNGQSADAILAEARRAPTLYLSDDEQKPSNRSVLMVPKSEVNLLQK